jgi:hypothetical protein
MSKSLEAETSIAHLVLCTAISTNGLLFSPLLEPTMARLTPTVVTLGERTANNSRYVSD